MNKLQHTTRAPRRRRAAAGAAALTGALLLAACTGGGTTEEGGASPSGPSSAPEEVVTQTTVAALTGRLDQAAQDQLAAAVTDVVDGWLDQAYLGEFPRTDFGPAFAGFTPGAAALAQQQPDLMTSAAIAGQIEQAEATAREVALDVLAVKGQPVGVMARVNLAFETTGTLAGPQQVTGTLDLTPVDGQWRVFGFDIASTTASTPVAPASPASPTSTTSEETQ